MEAGVFDMPAIRQSCWQTCDSDPGKFQTDLDAVPMYRDQDTRTAFYGLASFYGCVGECEHEYEIKRIVILVPSVLCAVGLLLLLIICAACSCCPLHKVCCGKKEKKMDSGPRQMQPQAQWAMPPMTAGPPPSPGGTVVYQRQISAISKSAPPHPATYDKPVRSDNRDQPHTAGGRIQVYPQHRAANNWVEESGGGGGRSLLQTASKLGRKLLHQDKDGAAKMRERRMSRDGNKF